jgi:hypothetical protein
MESLPGSTNSPCLKARRQLNTWFAFTPLANATCATLAPGSKLCSTCAASQKSNDAAYRDSRHLHPAHESCTHAHLGRPSMTRGEHRTLKALQSPLSLSL